MRRWIHRSLNIGYRLTHPVYAAVWRKLQPTTVGVKAVVFDPDGRVLLVKTRYQRWWTLPGGGVHRRESPDTAASREVREETGVRIDPEHLRFHGLFSNFAEGKSDYIAVFVAELTGIVEPVPGIEIEKAAFYDLDALPEETSPRRGDGWQRLAAGRLWGRGDRVC